MNDDVTALDWWRHGQKGVSKCYEQRISLTWNENRRYKTMATDYSSLYNQIFLVFIHPKIACQLAMTNDWELLIGGSKWAQYFRKHVKINLVPWKIAVGHWPNSIFHNKKNAAGGVKLPHPIWNRLNPSFQGVNRPFFLSFKDDDGRESHKQYYLPALEIKDYNVVIDGRNFWDQPLKKDLKTFDNIRKILTGQVND